ncbi:MAG TPA: MotA/TolQ/ExbB proton channel family protein [Vicinamibacterales bacterium]
MRTLGYLALALQVQGAAAPEGGLGGNVFRLVARSSPIAQGVLLILILFSIASWGIILFKLWSFRRSERQSGTFLDVFRKSSKFSEVHAVCKTLGDSPLVGLFQSGYAELNSQLRQPPSVSVTAQTLAPGSAPARPTLKSIVALDRALLRASSVEINKLESRVPFLATTASITPFIGLFGTVWGIISAFDSIGQTASTSLAVVAPGIAEALIATAAGLFAAIPAVYFYNHLAHRVKLFATQMDDFALEFLNIAERNFT